jgi:hypothetical protein
MSRETSRTLLIRVLKKPRQILMRLLKRVSSNLKKL